MSDSPDVVKICSDLIRIDSENPPGRTSEVIDYIGALLDDHGIEYRRTDLPGKKSNLYTNTSGKTLLLLGHVDVVPAIPDKWQHDPLSGRISEDSIYGRGASDMKGGCAAIITAFIEEYTSEEKTSACLCFVCDEETGGQAGVRYLLEERFMHPCDCVIAECTPYAHPCIGQKGLLRVDIEFRGKPGHASLYPEVGVSAIRKAVDFLDGVREISKREYPGSQKFAVLLERSGKIISEVTGVGPAENILKRITYNPGIIEGGEARNVVAERCTMELEMRIPWGCDPHTVLEELRSLADGDEIFVKEIVDPTCTGEDSRIATAAVKSIEKVYGIPSSPFVQWAATDARFLRKTGFDAIEYGPGEIDKIHGVDEFISIADLKRSVDVYRNIIRSYSGTEM